MSKLSAEEMRNIFVSNDIAVLPSSTTMLEAMACGIPIIGGYFVDNQINNYNQYVEAGAIIGCGNLIELANQMKVKDIIESGMLNNDSVTNSFIPQNLEENILEMFDSL